MRDVLPSMQHVGYKSHNYAGLLSKRMKGKPPANSQGGGWSDKEPNLLLANYDKTKAVNEQTIGSYDTVVFRVMHGWMKVHEITHERLVEAVELAHELLGAETVVLMVGGAIRQKDMYPCPDSTPAPLVLANALLDRPFYK